jgi:hypothetical protein
MSTPDRDLVLTHFIDKPTVTLETPPDLDRVSSFLNIRVKEIEAVYAEWSARALNS